MQYTSSQAYAVHQFPGLCSTPVTRPMQYTSTQAHAVYQFPGLCSALVPRPMQYTSSQAYAVHQYPGLCSTPVPRPMQYTVPRRGLCTTAVPKPTHLQEGLDTPLLQLVGTPLLCIPVLQGSECLLHPHHLRSVQ